MATGSARVEYRLVVDEFTGGARIQVPVPTTAARALTPGLVLEGGEPSGNSIVGLGWSLGGLPAITIDANEHLPRWDGRDDVALGGVGLVTWRNSDGTPRRRIEGDHVVTDLRPRHGFTQVKVERWVHRPTGEIHFRSRDANDVLTIYGARSDGSSRVADPRDPNRVAAWLPEVTVDAIGNAMWCEYAVEDIRGLDRAAPWEPRQPSTAQRYLTQIRYGNVLPLELTDALIAGQPPPVRFAFALVIDYGDHGSGDGEPGFAPDRPWAARSDAFSSTREGFVVHTYRRVRRIACFHDIGALGASPVAVSALELAYDEQPAGARLRSVRRVGYRDGSVARTTALTFNYAAAGIDRDVSTTASPVPLGARHRLVDLHGEGLSGVLYQGERGWLYRANHGGGRFAEPVLVQAQPNLDRAALGDLDRDGDTELAVVSGRQAGAFAFEREEARWTGFRPFSRWPRIEALVGRTFWVDLNGDGRADAVVARGDGLTWFPSRAGPLDEDEAEFDDPVVVPWPAGAEHAPGAGPDPALDLHFVDVTGDGLPDLVRLRPGAVEYWPSLGNGRFGERVVMDNPPRTLGAGSFDAARVRWVDLDGSGTADLLYLDDGELWHYPNLGGRRFGDGQRVGALPCFDARAAAVTDLTGEGRPTLVWASPGAGREPVLSYLPLAPDIPPGALVSVDDGCGRRTELTWGNSASHYLRDAADGVAWETRLPTHRPVVDARVERDRIGGTSVTTRYRYRDGYYDGPTGAFRGFGRVETLDTPASQLGDPEDPAVAAPLLTRTWFHLGTPMWNHHRPFEPYTGDPLAPLLPPHVEAGGPHRPADAAAALRLLAGTMVRRERWSVDEHEQPADHPFDVEQACPQLALVQPRHGAARPVFGVVPGERLIARYDERPGDPRITHDVIVAHDSWGSPTRTAEIAYARRDTGEDPAQTRTWVTVTDTALASVDTPGQFRLHVPIETRRFELLGVATTGGRITPASLAATEVAAALENPALFHTTLDPSSSAPAARRLAWQRTYYWNDARDDAAPLGGYGRAAHVHHVEEAALSSALVASAFGGRVDDALVTSLGYTMADGHAWCPGTIREESGPFAMPAGTLRGDGATMHIQYDVDWLAVVEIVDALGLSTRYDVDYRALAPSRTRDPNHTVHHVAFDAFGRAVAHGIDGRVGVAPWGSGPLAGWTAAPATALATILADPRGFLGAAAAVSWFDDHAWEERGQPLAEVTITRATWGHDGDGGGGGDPDGPLEITVRYLDGFGRVLQEKVRVEPGLAITRDASGGVIVDAGGPVLTHSEERWRVSGHVERDAKGQPRRVFEPYFSPTATYERDAELQQFGVATLTTYDAVGRVVRVDHPNGTYARTVHAPWSTEESSPGDTVLQSAYRALREGRPADDPERAAYEHAVSHADTPTIVHVDARGLVCATVAAGDGSAVERRVRHVVDASGLVIATIDPRGLTAFTYRRDLRGRVLATTSVDAGSSWTLADAYDRPARTWDARGHQIDHVFDRADRPIATHVRGGDGPAPLDHVVEIYRYGDEDANRDTARAANTLGRLVEVRDGAGVTRTLAYDPMGAVRASERRLRVVVDDAADWRTAVPVDAEALATEARTDALGRVIRRRFADGTERRDQFHPGGALAAVRLTTPDGALVDAPITDALVRDARGRITAGRLGNGCLEAWRYDRDTGRLVAQDADHGGRPLQRLRFTYDPDGKIVRALDLAQEGPSAVLPSPISARRDFRYDVHGRLVEATGRIHQALLPHDDMPGNDGVRPLSLDDGAALERYTQRFTYDASGNLRRIQHAGATASWSNDLWVAADSNRSVPAVDPNGVPVVDPAAHFDAAGNTIELAHLRSLAWNWRGCFARAVTITRPGGVDDDERYAYGADRLRTRKLATRLVTAGVIETREVVYAGDQERVRVRRNGTLVLERWTTHVGDGERRVAIVDRHTVDTLGHEVDQIGPARVRYHLTTPQGSTALELDEAGGLISYEEYLPYGGSAFVAGDDARDVARRDVRYAGKERDRATGLHAYPYRYYAPWLGRWLSCDPAGPKDDANLYQFVGGDPVGGVDPLGLERTLVTLGNWKNKQQALAAANAEAAERGVWVLDVERRGKVDGRNAWVITDTEPYEQHLARIRQQAIDAADAMSDSELLSPRLAPLDQAPPDRPPPDQSTGGDGDVPPTPHTDDPVGEPSDKDRAGLLDGGFIDGTVGGQVGDGDDGTGDGKGSGGGTGTGDGKGSGTTPGSGDGDGSGTSSDGGWLSWLGTLMLPLGSVLPSWAKTIAIGVMLVAIGIATMGVGVGVVAAMAIAGGIAMTATGAVQGILRATDQTTAEQDAEVTEAAMNAGALSNPGGLAGGAIGAGVAGEKGMQTGAVIGSLAEVPFAVGSGIRSWFARRAGAEEAQRIAATEAANAPAATPAGSSLSHDEVAALLEGAEAPTAADIRAGAAAGDSTAQGVVGELDRAAAQQAASKTAYGDIGALASAESSAGAGVVSGRAEIFAKARAAQAGDVQALGEIQAAKVLQAEGKNVHFQTPTGRRGSGTADLLVGGEAGTGKGGMVVDVLTPRTTNPENVFLGIASKNDQAPNIIVNIRNNPSLTPAQLGTEAEILEKVRALIEPAGGTMNIRSVRVIK